MRGLPDLKAMRASGSAGGIVGEIADEFAGFVRDCFLYRGVEALNMLQVV